MQKTRRSNHGCSLRTDWAACATPRCCDGAVASPSCCSLTMASACLQEYRNNYLRHTQACEEIIQDRHVLLDAWKYDIANDTNRPLASWNLVALAHRSHLDMHAGPAQDRERRRSGINTDTSQKTNELQAASRTVALLWDCQWRGLFANRAISQMFKLCLGMSKKGRRKRSRTSNSEFWIPLTQAGEPRPWPPGIAACLQGGCVFGWFKQ